MRKSDPETVFVYASAEEYPEVAAYLLAIADERGYDRKLIRTTFQGFEVPAGMLLEGEYVESVPAGVKDVTKDAPDWFFTEPRKVDIEAGKDGALYLKEDVAQDLAKEFNTTVEEINKQFDLDELESKNKAEEKPEDEDDEKSHLTRNEAAVTVDLIEEHGGEDEELSETEVIRAWARDHGHKVADTGRLSKAVLEAYEEAHSGE